jgi:redox-sensitive bicupin YhaK (pirin superfamily)
MRHRDSTGREGVIGPGGVQWMRAGKGVVHSEMPEQAQGRMRGFQLWVNLPAALKLSPPDYQEFDADKIPHEARDGGVEVRVIAGRTSRGLAGPIAGGAVDPLYFDVSLPAGARFEEPVGEGRNVMVVVFEGTLKIGGMSLAAPQAAFLGEGDVVQVEGETDARLLLIAGRPIEEPVVWGGPFVMNTREEVMAAFEDYRAGRF